MKRGSPLKRRTALRPKRTKPRRTSQVRDRAYLDDVKQLPCCAAELDNAGRCWGPIDPHHIERAGMSLRGSDLKCAPLCRKHHGDVEDFTGPFKGWNRAKRTAWLEERVLETQALVAARRRWQRVYERMGGAA